MKVLFPVRQTAVSLGARRRFRLESGSRGPRFCGQCWRFAEKVSKESADRSCAKGPAEISVEDGTVEKQARRLSETPHHCRSQKVGRTAWL